MNLIDKIKELFKPILDFDDLCEIEWGKQDLCREVLNLIEDHEPEPPKVRPMSELPELNEKHYLFAFAPIDNLKEVRYVSLCRLNPVGILASWRFNFKTNNHLSLCKNYILVGWLYELPDPTKIEL